MGVIKK